MAKVIPTYIGLIGDTGVYRVALSSFGTKSIKSITIYDDNVISGGSGGASGVDPDFIKISSTLISSASGVSALTDAGGFQFSSTYVSADWGFMTPWRSSHTSDWNTSQLFGRNADGSVNFSFASFGTLDGQNGSGAGSISLGEGGSVTFVLPTAVDPSGLYLYFGDVGGGNDGCYVAASDSATPTAATGVSLTGTSSADEIRLGSGTNAQVGLGNDTLTGGSGNDTIDGAAGFDTAVFSGKRSDYTVTRSGNTITVSGADGTDTLTNVERLMFDDRMVVGNLGSPQTQSSSFTATAGGNSLTIQQVSMSDVVDSSRGTLSSRVQVNGQDVTGVTATLKKGWKVGGIADVNGDGTPEIFFFGVDTVNGVGSGYGATWSVNGSGAVTNTRIQLQMQRQGWEVAGTANVNGLAGDEILWQNTLTGDKAIWTDANADGALESGFVISGLGNSTAERIIGVCDLDKDGIKEFMLFSDATQGVSVYEASPLSTGSVTATLANTFTAYADFQSAATAAGATYTVFPFVT